MLRGARSICGTESGGGRCRVIVAQTRSLRLGDQGKRVAAAGGNNSQHIPEAAAAFTCTETRGPESRRWRHARRTVRRLHLGSSQPLRAAQTASVAAQYGRVTCSWHPKRAVRGVRAVPQTAPRVATLPLCPLLGRGCARRLLLAQPGSSDTAAYLRHASDLPSPEVRFRRSA
jgi:hypothetical protein